jgi:hypothetical protein
MQTLRLVILDATDVGRFGADPGGGADGTSRRGPGLTPVWSAGARLFDAMGRVDAWIAATNWRDALRWAADQAQRAGRPIGSLQAWGHGGFGFMRIAQTALDGAALRQASALAPALDAVRDALAPGSSVWLRCCSAFGHDGRTFARSLADRLRARVAGHTYIIGFYQSGTHSLSPGDAPTWDPREGVRFEAGRAAGARWSTPWAPNTITCLASRLPPEY